MYLVSFKKNKHFSELVWFPVPGEWNVLIFELHTHNFLGVRLYCAPVLTGGKKGCPVYKKFGKTVIASANFKYLFLKAIFKYLAVTNCAYYIQFSQQDFYEQGTRLLGVHRALQRYRDIIGFSVNRTALNHWLVSQWQMAPLITGFESSILKESSQFDRHKHISRICWNPEKKSDY